LEYRPKETELRRIDRQPDSHPNIKSPAAGGNICQSEKTIEKNCDQYLAVLNRIGQMEREDRRQGKP
jgi:hypothetical protein